MLDVAQATAAAVVLARLNRGRRRRPALNAEAAAPTTSISAVVPARDEARRIAPCLRGLLGDSDIGEVIVVDDGSADATAEIARRLGARVICAGALPPGWVGKPWALQRGLEAAVGDVVVSLDADTRPQVGLARALAAALPDADLITAGARFTCHTAGERFLHPALLATLVYRFGPPDAGLPSPARLLVNGQCVAVRRRALLDAGGYAPAAGHMTDDAALARALARRGWRIAFHDAGPLLAVDMHDSILGTWREWGRSIALSDVTAGGWQIADMTLLWLTLALPWLRVLAGRPRPIDIGLLALRWLLAFPLASSYTCHGPAYWLSPMADPLAVIRVTLAAVRPARRWRGRVYDAEARTAGRSGPSAPRCPRRAARDR